MHIRVAIFVLFIFISTKHSVVADDDIGDHESEANSDRSQEEQSENEDETANNEDRHNDDKENGDVTGNRYSFFKFRGPVSGEVREVPVESAINPGQPATDHVANPDYSYTYGVHDGPSGNSHTHSESRDGDRVSGEYRVLQADGLVRIVRYSAHPTTGFVANVEYVKI